MVQLHLSYLDTICEEDLGLGLPSLTLRAAEACKKARAPLQMLWFQPTKPFPRTCVHGCVALSPGAPAISNAAMP